MKKGFTLGELTITLIIITVVVIITLPITLNKMKRVDGDAYYMGYDTAVDIWANLSSDLQPEVTYEYPDDDGSNPGSGGGGGSNPPEPEPEPEKQLGTCEVTHIDVGQDDRPIGGMTYENVTEEECYVHSADSCGYNCATDVEWTPYN